MKARSVAAVAAFFVAAALAAGPAAAQTAWVSGTGNDAASCPRTAPCATWQAAHDASGSGGEINCVSAGNFGPLVINRSITIDCAGAYGAAAAAVSGGASAVRIDGNNINVTIRNLTIRGPISISDVTAGIHYVRGGELTVENVNIYGFSGSSITVSDGYGIRIQPTSGVHRINVNDSAIRRNGRNSSNPGGGILLAPTGAAQVRLILNNVELASNHRALDINTTGTTAGNQVIVRNSHFLASSDNGITVTTNANALNIMIEGSTIADNLRGLVVNGAGGAARIGTSVIAGNGPAFAVSGGGTIQSYRNNQIELNGNNGTPLPPVTLQ